MIFSLLLTVSHTMPQPATLHCGVNLAGILGGGRADPDDLVGQGVGCGEGTLPGV